MRTLVVSFAGMYSSSAVKVCYGLGSGNHKLNSKGVLRERESGGCRDKLLVWSDMACQFDPISVVSLTEIHIQTRSNYLDATRIGSGSSHG